MTTEVVKTIRASGGDYTTLSAWEAALPASLVTNDEQHTAVCYNDWPSGLNDPVQVVGPATDATRFIKITVAEGHRHNGTPKSGFFLEGTRSINGAMLEASVAYTVLEWLDVEHLRNSNNSHGIQVSGSYSRVDACLAAATYAGGSNAACDISAGSTSNTEATWVVVTNCLAYGSGYYGIANRGDTTRQRAKYLNCVAAGSHSVGFLSHSVVPGHTINCVAYGNTTDFSGSGWSASSDYNASSDTSANVFAHYVTGVDSSDFVDASGGDFHLASGSAPIGAGANLYATFDHDVDGDIRPSSGAWDIGFDHYVASGGPAAELDGDAASTASAAGALTTDITMTGAAAVIATATGAITTAINLGGTAAAHTSASGAATTGIKLGGSAGAVASASGTLDAGSAALAGSAASISIAGGTLTTTIRLNGAALAHAIASAGLTTGIPLAGAGAGQATATGNLTAGAAGLDGDATAVTTAAASLTTQITLSGAAMASALATAGLTTTPAGLGGAATATASATGALLTSIPLAGTAQAHTTSAGGLSTIIVLDGAGAAVSSATGELTVSATMSGAALAAAAAGGTLTTEIRLNGAAIAQALATATLGTVATVPGNLTHTISAPVSDWTISARQTRWEIAA